MAFNEQKLIHTILGHSYLFYLVGFLVGAVLHMFFGYQLAESPMNFVGIVLIIVGSVITFWAQATSRETKQIIQGKEVIHEHFYRGPYKYTRSPTQLSLGYIMIGVAFIFNSLLMMICAILSFFIVRYIFINKEEHMLEKKYGEPYQIYKKRVKF